MKRNDVGTPVEIVALRGDAGCYFVVTYSPNDPGKIIND